MSKVIEKVRLFLSDNTEIDVSSVTNETPLFSSGLVDSFSLIELLVFLENEMGAAIDFAELEIDDFDTIESIAGLAA